jgi:hypothetical protein
MDELERRNRWRGMTLDERHDALWPKSNADQRSSTSAAAPSLASLIRSGPALAPEANEAMAHNRRSAQAYSQIRRELESEAEQAAQAQRDAHMTFRRDTALGQLMGARR